MKMESFLFFTGNMQSKGSLDLLYHHISLSLSVCLSGCLSLSLSNLFSGYEGAKFLIMYACFCCECIGNCLSNTPTPLDGFSTALQNFGQSAVNRSRSDNSAVEASRS